jgi:FixJ family two-component response regulator/anti-sigma regulatory factor (Ser/Thr protein kinase)
MLVIKNRVVIVDAEIKIRESLTRIVKHEHLVSDAYDDGREAFEALREHHDDVVLVIADIKMPSLNGLEFMRLANAEFPGIPFIVTSGHGTKREIIQALKQGALDYFEKPFGLKEISASIRKVRRLADAGHKTVQVYRNLIEKRVVFRIANDIALVHPLVGGLIDEVRLACRIPPSQLPGLRMGLHELIVNAIEHGNLELGSELKDRHNYLDLLKHRAREPRFSERRVMIEVVIVAGSFTCMVQDQGPGFDWRSLPDPTDPENLFKPHGRGVIMAGNFFDEFFYSESGNQVTVRKFFKNGGIVKNSDLQG